MARFGYHEVACHQAERVVAGSNYHEATNSFWSSNPSQPCIGYPILRWHLPPSWQQSRGSSKSGHLGRGEESCHGGKPPVARCRMKGGPPHCVGGRQVTHPAQAGGRLLVCQREERSLSVRWGGGRQVMVIVVEKGVVASCLRVAYCFYITDHGVGLFVVGDVLGCMEWVF